MSDLLALSDVLVIRALERAYTKALDGSVRSALALKDIARHRAYETIQIPGARHARALEGAFALTGEIAAAWDLPIDPAVWAALLDGYCRHLLTTRQPRALADLDAALAPLGARHGA